MTVARRLQSAFVIYIALLAVVVVYHVRTIRGVVDSGHALTEISSRLRATSTDQLARIAQLSDDAEKFLVTRDVGYMDKYRASAADFGAELSRMNATPLTASEREALVPLITGWRTVEGETPALAAIETASEAAGRATVSTVQASLGRIRAQTEAVGLASQDAMRRELDASERAAQSATRLSWLAALGALVLSILLSAQIIRSIVGPLGRLTEGTREVSAGRFSYRLDASGGDELAQVARDFNSMTERLDELDRMKRDFSAKVSHDLKTPLSSMQETIGALLDDVAGPLTPKQRHLLELNLESSRRLSAMLTKLLDLSRIEARLEPEHRPIDLVDIVTRAVGRADGSRVKLVEPERRAVVRGDTAGITQVLDNLIENAAKFSPPGGVVEVRVAPTAAGVLVTVADEGPGIPDDEKEKVFTRFYQTEAGRAARGRGVGLGLTLCREIVAAHGGRIWVADNEPRGSVFSMLLPVVALTSEPPAEQALASVGVRR